MKSTETDATRPQQTIAARYLPLFEENFLDTVKPPDQDLAGFGKESCTHPANHTIAAGREGNVGHRSIR